MNLRTTRLKYYEHVYYFSALAFVLSIVFLLYNQILSPIYGVKRGLKYRSDFDEHVLMATQQHAVEGYSLFHLVVRFASDLLSPSAIEKTPTYAIIAILTVCLSSYVSVEVSRGYFRGLANGINSYKSDFLALSLSLLSMLVVYGQEHLYLGVWTPNPWHNPTYSFAKPFALLVFIALVKTLHRFTDEKSSGPWLPTLSVVAVLSMWAKPSFLISFLPTVALVLTFYLARGKLSFKHFASIGAILLPALLPLYHINQLIYESSGSTGSVMFAFSKVWGNYSSNIPLSILLGAAFPLYVLFVERRRIDPSILLAAVNYGVAMLIFLCLAESGERMAHANFAWTVMSAMLIFFLVAMGKFFFNSYGTWQRRIGLALFCAHLGSGIYYYGLVISGATYH